MSTDNLRVLVTGASGLLGRQLVKKLHEHNHCVFAIGRQSCPEQIEEYCTWLKMDMTQDIPQDFGVDVLVHVAPLWLLPGFYKRLSSQPKRCIVFSSTSAQSKVDAHDDKDRELAAKLLAAEADIKSMSGTQVGYTIFRPTMIYGYGQDQNISVIAQFILQKGFFPLAGKARGLRQPVHVDDLVDAVINVMTNEKTFAKTYSLTGAETMTYKQMIGRIFAGLNKPVRIVTLPVFLYRFLLKLKKSGYSGGTADRMNQDLSYNSQDAENDFNYKSRMFLTNPKRDLPGI